MYVILTVPALTAVTTPETEPTVATLVLLLDHIPPPVPVNTTELPTHIALGPDIGPGEGFTTMVTLALQPVDNVYMIVAEPGATPVTTPDDEPTVAMLVLLLVQTPPAVLFVSVMDDPAQTDVGPAMATGLGFTVTTAVEMHPEESI